MPVTKTAKRALRGSKRKEKVNNRIRNRMEAAIRLADKKKTKDAVQNAISIVDRAAKKNIVHKNKAARIKSRLSKIKNTNSSGKEKGASKSKKK